MYTVNQSITHHHRLSSSTGLSEKRSVRQNTQRKPSQLRGTAKAALDWTSLSGFHAEPGPAAGDEQCCSGFLCGWQIGPSVKNPEIN